MNLKQSLFGELGLQKRCQEIIDKKQFEEDNPDCGVTYEQYTMLFAQFDTQFAEFANAQSLEQLLPILDYFERLTSFTIYPNKIETEEFMLILFSQIQKYPSDEILAKFSRITACVYNNKSHEPPMPLFGFIIQMITTNINPPLNEYLIKVSINFLLILSTYSPLIPTELINNPEFFGSFLKFRNITPHLNTTLIYFYKKLLKYTDSIEVVSIIPTIIQTIYDTVFPHVLSTVQTDEFSSDILLNITSFIREFVAADKRLAPLTTDKKSKVYMSEDYFELIFLPLSSLWNYSDEVNENLFLILTILSEEFKHFKNPQAFFQLLQKFLEDGGHAIIIESISKSTNCTHRSLNLLKYLIRFNYMDGTQFIYANDEESGQMYGRIIYFCINGRMYERLFAGKCFAEIIKRNSTLGLENFLLEGQGDLNLSQEILQDVNLLSSKPCLILQILVAYHIESLAKTIIRTLYYLSEKAYNLQRMHEFRETCDLYQVDEMAIDISSEFSDLSDLVAQFTNTAFGPLPYD